MNIKKLFSVAAVVTFVGSTFLNGLALAATPDTELGKAYEWAHSKGITTMDTYEAANMDKPITRAQMAKMLSVYAMSELGMKPDTTKTECNEFNDIANITGDLHEYIITSCQLGLMGQQIFSGIKEFRPNANISRAEFGTALSRTLWGGKYEGGTPYYANHLQALQSAGIMKIIANAETTQEIRGYVMLMLMRSAEGSEAKADCEDPMIKAACLIDDDSCPAECKESASDEKEDTVVKSGSLVVKSSAAEDRSIVVPSDDDDADTELTAVSDLDTLTFKTSEEVTISKVVLEKFGYSSSENLIANVWLEDEDGKEVSNKTTPNTKGLVNLTIKKDYKVVDGTFNAVIVVETKEGAKVGGTLGFKVTDVTSTAKDVDLGNYKAYTYDVVAYDGTTAKVTAKGGNKDYNYEGKAVEISKFKIKAPDDSAILVKSFTLTNNEDATFDIYDNIDTDDVEVSIDGKVVKANISINKSQEMTISLKDDLEISAKAQVEVIVTSKFNSDFEDYGTRIQLEIANSSDLSATDKNNARITVDTTSANGKWVIYEINGGEIKITNTKLGTIEASINSTDVLIAEGYITVKEDIEKGKLVVDIANYGAAIESMKLEFAGDEIDGSHNNDRSQWTFSNVEASESGKIKLYVDIYDNVEYEGKTLNFEISGWDTFYYTNGSRTSQPDISGTLTISKLTLTPAEGTLINNLSSSDDVEFTNKETNTEVVFDGTYKADKQDINLNSFTIKGTNKEGSDDTKIKFYLYVDDMETAVANVTVIGAGDVEESDSFNDILVKAGETVKVKVEAEVKAVEEADDLPVEIGKLMVILDGEDENDNNAGHAERRTSRIMIVDKGSVSVTDSSVAKKAVLKKASSATIAEFTVKPDGANSVLLETITFDLGIDGEYDGNIDLYVGESKKTLKCVDGDTTTFECSAEFSTTVKSDGVVVKVELDDELDGSIDLTNLEINENPAKKEFSKTFVDAVVWFQSQSFTKSKTTFKFGVDKKKDSTTIENVKIKLDGAEEYTPINELNEIKAGVSYDVTNGTGAANIVELQYTVDGADTPITIKSADYPDMFRLGMKEDGDRVYVEKATD